MATPRPEGPSSSPGTERSLSPGAGVAASEKSERDPLQRFAPSAPPGAKPARRPVVLRPAHLGGDRDWIIYVECKPDGLVLYPSRLVVPLSALPSRSASNNPLLLAVQQMINRRQATLRPEEPPYRPQVRFLVRPETVRAYHVAYPALEALPVPKTRQNLDPEDDAAAIAAGQ